MGQSVRGVLAAMETTLGHVGSQHRNTHTPLRLVPGGCSSPGEGPCATHLDWFPSRPYHFTGGIMTKALLLFRAQLNASSFGGDPGWGENLHS